MKSELKIKICGLRETQNILDICRLQPDMIGFIFYNKSSRYAGYKLDQKVLRKIPAGIKKVGVFVNADYHVIEEICRKYSLDIIQLHGDETTDYCRQLNKNKIIIKSFAVDNNFDFDSCKDFEPYCDYFLFDTKGINYGGNSIRFDWCLLSQYSGNRMFILSGGVGPDNLAEIKEIRHNRLAGIDINSKFETEPGFKDVEKVKEFICGLKD